MATLYEIDTAIVESFNKAIDPETGEIIDPQAWQDLERLSVDRETKIENIALFYKNLCSDAAAYKAEKDSFAAKQKAAEKKAGRLADYLKQALQGETFRSAKVDVRFRKSLAVDITEDLDMSKIPDIYKREKTVIEIDKSAAGKDLKAGVEIPGLRLTEHQNILIK